MQTDYIVDCGFDRLRVRADLDQATALIFLVQEDRNGGTEMLMPTGYRTADAGHDIMIMARLAILAAGQDWWHNVDDGPIEADNVDAYIDALVKSVTPADASVTNRYRP